jgi:hypothetical protein
MKSPISIDAKAIFIFRGVGLRRKPIPINISVIPMILARVWDWLIEKYCFNYLNPPDICKI